MNEEDINSVAEAIFNTHKEEDLLEDIIKLIENKDVAFRVYVSKIIDGHLMVKVVSAGTAVFDHDIQGKIDLVCEKIIEKNAAMSEV